MNRLITFSGSISSPISPKIAFKSFSMREAGKLQNDADPQRFSLVATYLAQVTRSGIGCCRRGIVLVNLETYKTSFHYQGDAIKWKHFPRYWPFVRGIHQLPVNSLHKGQWRRALMFYLICAWIKCWVNNREAGDLRHHRAHYDVIVMTKKILPCVGSHIRGRRPISDRTFFRDICSLGVNFIQLWFCVWSRFLM